MAGLCLRHGDRPDRDAQIRHPRPARLLRQRPALAAPLRVFRAGRTDAAWRAEPVKYEVARERRLLELLEAEDEGHGVEFSDHSYIRKGGFSGADRFLQMHDLSAGTAYHLRLMENVWYVERSGVTDTSETYSLTLTGHERLNWHRDQDYLPRTKRWLGTTLGVLFTSIVIPVLVSVFTVLALGVL